MNKLDLSLIRAFTAIYEEQSVSKAAQRLGLSQSSVSGLLARLRDVLADPLFVRAQRGMVPTPRAVALAGRMKEVALRIEELAQPERFDPLRAEATVRISANDYGHNVVLLAFINSIRERAPRVRVALMPFETEELAPKLARGQLDLAITIPEMTPDELPRQFLFRDEYVGVVGRTHALARGAVGLDDFCRFDHVVVSPMGGSFDSATDEALERLGRRRRVVYSLPSFQTALEIVQDQDLIAVLPERLVIRHSGSVRRFALPAPVKGFEAISVWHPRTTRSPLHAWLRAELAEAAAQWA